MVNPPRSAGRQAAYEVLAVRYGTRQTRRSEVFLHYEIYGEPDADIGMDYFFWMVRNPDRVVLVDCGFSHQGGNSRGRTMLCPPVLALSRLGLVPADVGTVIVTHAHYDHIGNLGAFTAAEIVMSRREFGFWTGPLGTRRLFAYAVEAGEIEQLRALSKEGRIRLFSDRLQVAPGIELVEVGGHTPGQLIVLVAVPCGEVVLASDALHYYEEADRDRPFAHVADLGDTYRAFDLLRDLSSPGRRTLVAGHDPEVMTRFPRLPGDLAELAVRVS
jgi:glyoxylase-like metal-dependent hydrolase (beta-lactamase superfamily II)